MNLGFPVQTYLQGASSLPDCVHPPWCHIQTAHVTSTERVSSLTQLFSASVDIICPETSFIIHLKFKIFKLQVKYL